MTRPKTITANGNAQVSTAQNKFGGASALFDGTGDYLSVATSTDFGFGTGDFTIEGWFYKTSATSQWIFDTRTTTPQVSVAVQSQGSGTIRLLVSGSFVVTSSNSHTNNAWNHLAISRASGVTRLFINGVVSTNTYSDTNNYGATKPLIIGAQYNGTTAFAGYIDEFRVTKGLARYTTTFTPSTTAFANDVDTVLLLHMDGANASTSFVDDYVATTRESTDNLYIDLGYFTPEDYYVYEAEALAAITSQATFVCEADSSAIVDFVCAMSSSVTQTTDAVKTVEALAPLGTAFTAVMSVDAFRITDVNLVADFVMATDFERNRSVDIALATAITQSLQADRIRDNNIDLSAAVTQTAQAEASKEFSAPLQTSFTQTTSAQKLLVGASQLDTAFTQTAIGNRVNRLITSSAFVGDAYSTLEITSEQNKFGGFSLKVPATTPVDVNGEQVFWTGTAFKIIQTGTTWTSTDGVTWTTASNNLSLTPTSTNLVYQNSQFLIKDGSTIAYANSTGTSFSTTTLADSGSNDYYDRIDYFNGSFYVPHRRFTSPSTNDPIGVSVSASLSSPSWSNIQITSINESIGGGIQIGTIASSGSTLAFQIKASDNSDYSIYRSTNGTSWSGAVPPTTDNVELTFANSQWVLWSSTAIWTSSDLITWTSQSITVTGSIQAVTYLNTKWIVQTSYALYSGSALNSLSAVIVKNFNEQYEFFPAFGSSKYIVLTNDEVLYSTDAVTWSADVLSGVTGLPGYIEYTGDSDINSFSSIDFWLYNDNTNSNFSYIFTRASGLSNFRILLTSNTLQVIVTDGTTVRSLSTGNILALGWNHIRFVQDGANASIYSGGTRRATSTNWLSFSTDTFYIGGRDANKPLYIDEFLISDTILTPTATTTYTVPTVPWTNSDTVDALFHYDTNFEDDNAAPARLVSAVIPLTATFTQTALGGLIADTSAQLNTSATATVTAEAIYEGDFAGADAVFTQTVDATRIFPLSAQFDAIVSQVTVVAKIGDTLVSANSEFAQTTTVNVIAEGVAQLDSAFTQSTENDRIRDTDFDGADAVFTVTADANAVRDTAAALSSQFTQSTQNDRIRDTDFAGADAVFTQIVQAETILDLSAQLNTAATQTIDGTRIIQFSTEFASTATQLTAAAKVGDTLANMPVTATMTVVGDASSGAVIAVNSQFSLQAQGGLVLDASAALNTAFALQAQPEIVIVAQAQLNTAFALTAQAQEISSAIVFETATVTLSVDGQAIRNTEAQLNTAATQVVQAQRTRTVLVDMQTIATQLTVGSEQSSGVIQLNSAFTLTVDTAIINIDPDLTYVIPEEIRSYSLGSETRSRAILDEIRTTIVIEELRETSVANTEELYII